MFALSRTLPLCRRLRLGVCCFTVAGPYLFSERLIVSFPSEPSYSEKYGWQISISPFKKVSVRKWQDLVLIDIRTFWDPNNDGNLVPTKRGIALTEQQWESVVSHRLDIQKLMDLCANDKTTSSQTQEVNDLFYYV